MGVVGCAGLLGGVIGKAPLPAAFAAASVAAAAREEEYNASICRAEHMLSALDSVLAQKLSHRLQELASARADAAVTHERVLKEWVDGKRDMMALQGAHERLLRDHDAAEEKRTEVNEMLKKERTEVDIAQALLAEEKEFTNQIASERDSIAKILRELLSLLWQCENVRQTSEALIMQDLQGKLQEVNLLTIKLNTVNCALVLAQQGAQERQSELLDLSADLAKSRTQAAKDSEEQERVHGELTRVRARNSQLQDEGTGVKERLIRQTEFVTERLGLLAMVRNPHFVFTCLVRPPVACAHACADVCVACAHAFADVCG
jgi:hypothetical protein